MSFLLALLVLFAVGADPDPTIKWNPSLESMGDGLFELVLSGDVAPGYYTHPMSDGFSGTSLEIDGQDGLELVGSPAEEYSLSDYKGTDVIEGSYVIRQRLKVAEKQFVSGNISWISCSGDSCNMPEEYEFSLQAALPQDKDYSIWSLILQAVLWGLAMLLTPCVFPMVPMTVSFFIKGSPDIHSGRLKALFYGLSIVFLYTLPVCIIIGLTRLLGGDSVTADIFNWLSTHWIPNVLFFVIFMIFAASFFGAFELTLPSSWINKSDRKSESNGLAGIFFLALTLVLVSFSCTGPIVGTVLIKSTEGEFWAPMVTMLAFSVAFALPFTVLALFPSLLKSLPKSGGWLNSVKVVLGFIEIALGFKFLSTADQTYHWHLLDREVYLAIWIVCFTMLGFYLLGKIRFRNDSELKYVSVVRLALSIACFSFVVYMIPGMWGAPLKALSGYLPPLETQDFVLSSNVSYTVDSIENKELSEESSELVALPHGLYGYANLDRALKTASVSGKPVFVDMTGHGCVNCREMEARVWSDPLVLDLLKNEYVIAVLYMDDKSKVPESAWVTTDSGKVLKDVGRINSYLAKTRFGVNAQPNYALLSSDGQLLLPVRGYDLSVPGFIEFLEAGLK